MKAIWLEKVGRELDLCDVDPPVVKHGSVVVDVLSVRVPANTRDVLEGKPPYILPTPFILGPACIGRVTSVGDDVMDVKPGEIVLCNSLLSSGAADKNADEILIGWTGNGTDRGAAMQRLWRHGSFAEQAIYPRSCITALSGAASFEPAKLAALASIAIADAALQRANVQSGQTVVILGATGQLGSCAVLAALARGAGRIIAFGRNKRRLDDLHNLSPRVEIVSLGQNITATESEDGLRQADVVLDFQAHVEDPSPTVSMFERLCPGGTAVLVGGRRGEVPVRYDWIMRNQITLKGSFMFDERSAAATWAMVASGVLDIAPVRTQAYALADMGRAIDQARHLGGLDMAVLLPNDI